MHLINKSFLSIFVLLFVAARVYGQNLGDPAKTQWHITPYLWLVGLDGEVAVNDIRAPIKSGITDLFDNRNFFFEVHIEAFKHPWSGIIDFSYLDISLQSDGTTTADRADMVFFTLEGSAAYRLSFSEWNPEVIVGLRLNNLKSRISQVSGSLPIIQDDRKNWIDPLIGFRAYRELGQSWLTGARFDVGGVGVGSDLSWHFNYFLGLKLSPKVIFFLTYQILDYQYKDGGFEYDMRHFGPVFGVDIKL